jgi:hypothetical protein
MQYSAFLPHPRQDILPILLSDNWTPLQPPTIHEYNATIAGARSRLPVSENGLVVRPPIESDLGICDLRGDLGWTLLMINLATWVFLFPTQDVGGLRTALVPRSTAYKWGGMATPRVGLAVPALACQSGLDVCMAHEIVHTYGLLHAGCPREGSAGAPSYIDPELPEELQVYAVRRSKSGQPEIAPAGTPTLMTYCRLNSRCPDRTVWDRVRENIPN